MPINLVTGQPASFDQIDNLLFVYGSNMNPLQLARRCHAARVLGPARLDHFKLSFYGRMDAWDGAQETVEPSEGDVVWGALIEISSLEWTHMDQWMDARLDGAGMYFHLPVSVTGVDGLAYRCRLYKKDICDKPGLPSSEYLQHILQGALDKQLPRDYIERLLAYNSKPAAYKVPLRFGYDPGKDAGFGCTDCSSAAPIQTQKGPLCVLPSI
jgi:gamma-glutamylcyclotransferase (GGCT)/AIG2-like uncharacterized protein YtfP